MPTRHTHKWDGLHTRPTESIPKVHSHTNTHRVFCRDRNVAFRSRRNAQGDRIIPRSGGLYAYLRLAQAVPIVCVFRVYTLPAIGGC